MTLLKGLVIVQRSLESGTIGFGNAVVEEIYRTKMMTIRLMIVRREDPSRFETYGYRYQEVSKCVASPSGE
jgi:hypothetical protein